jgi:glyoxylase-like metal-dependent hydrolase (beta-lactamase superfamily II)
MSVDGPTYEIIVKGNNLRLAEGFLGMTNLTLIKGHDGYILVDVGHTVNRLALERALERRGLAPRDIRRVFLSHLHNDHVMNIDLFPYSTEVFVSRTEFEYAANPHPKDPWIPWMVREQVSKYRLNFLEGAGELQAGVRYVPAPGHTPGCYALILDTPDKGRVVVAQDAIKFPKEALNARVDHAFDTQERAAETIRTLLPLADRLIPGHFMEMYREHGSFTWDDTMEFPIVIR